MGVLERLLPRRFTLQLVLVVAGSMLIAQALYTRHTADEQGDVIEQVLRAQAQALAVNIAANAIAEGFARRARSEAAIAESGPGA